MNAIVELLNLRRFFATHPLTRNAPLNAWGRFTSWQIRSRLHDEIIFEWIGGQRLAVQNGMLGATGNIYVGLLEFVDMMVPLHFLREDDVFLDVGANVGTYTVIASGVCRAKTLAFEPDPGTVRHLERNVALNGLESLVTVHECALGAQQGEVAFIAGLDTLNRIVSGANKHARMVRMERLDDLIGDSEPIMMKVDVEGTEEGVLLGAKALLANPCLRVVELETVTAESADILHKNEFETAYYDPFSHSLSRAPFNLNPSNTLFVRDWPFVESRLATARKVEVMGRVI